MKDYSRKNYLRTLTRCQKTKGLPVLVCLRQEGKHSLFGRVRPFLRSRNAALTKIFSSLRLPVPRPSLRGRVNTSRRVFYSHGLTGFILFPTPKGSVQYVRISTASRSRTRLNA